MKLFLLGATLLCLLLALFTRSAVASLGASQSACNALYGERWQGDEGDDYHVQNTTSFYRNSAYGTTVVYDRDGLAIEIRYSAGLGKSFPATRIAELLKLNGNAWSKERAKLGSAMDARRPPEIWLGPDGKRAELQTDGAYGQTLKLISAERTKQIADHRALLSPQATR